LESAQPPVYLLLSEGGNLPSRLAHSGGAGGGGGAKSLQTMEKECEPSREAQPGWSMPMLGSIALGVESAGAPEHEALPRKTWAWRTKEAEEQETEETRKESCQLITVSVRLPWDSILGTRVHCCGAIASTFSGEPEQFALYW